MNNLAIAKRQKKLVFYEKVSIHFSIRFSIIMQVLKSLSYAWNASKILSIYFQFEEFFQKL